MDHMGQKILVVEDGEDNRLLVELFLEAYPCRLKMAGEGEEAVRKYTAEPFDVVLLDMQLPVKDGYAAAREMRTIEREQRRKPAYVIAMTASTSEEGMEACRKAGCDDFLPKPLSPHRLIDMLRQAEAERKELLAIKPSVKALIPGYLRHREQDACRIERLLAAGNYAEIGTIGHRMKGSGGGYGLYLFSELGDRLERAACMEQSAEIDKLTAELRTYLNRTRGLFTENDVSS